MTTSAGTGTEGFSISTRERMASVERTKAPAKTPTETLADQFLAHNDAQRARWKADEQRKIDERHAQNLKDQAAEDRRRKQSIFEWRENMVEAIYDQHNLSASERGQANTALGDDVHNLEKATVESLRIVAERRN